MTKEARKENARARKAYDEKVRSISRAFCVDTGLVRDRTAGRSIGLKPGTIAALVDQAEALVREVKGWSIEPQVLRPLHALLLLDTEAHDTARDAAARPELAEKRLKNDLRHFAFPFLATHELNICLSPGRAYRHAAFQLLSSRVPSHPSPDTIAREMKKKEE